MDAFSEINVPLVKKNYSVLEKADLIVLDGNPPIETMSAILDIAKTLRKPGMIVYLFILTRTGDKLQKYI